MTERREPTISTYSPSKDDAQARPRPSSDGGGNKPRGEAPRSSMRSPAAQPVVVKSKLAPFAFLLALIAAAAAGFIYWQLLETQKVLSLADERIAQLESNFEITDGEVATTTEQMTAKLQWADSEIRKLWGVAYDTNRKAIEANKARIDEVAKTATAAQNAVDKKIQAAAKSINAELSIVSELVDAQQASLMAIERQSKKIVSDAQAINDKINSLQNTSRELERKVGANEQAIEAIDAFRRNVNQQLLQLKSGG